MPVDVAVAVVTVFAAVAVAVVVAAVVVVVRCVLGVGGLVVVAVGRVVRSAGCGPLGCSFGADMWR